MLPKLIDWLKDHLLARNNVHGSSSISKPNTLIETNSTGKIDKTWLNESGDIQSNTFKSSGTITNTGYLLSNDVDISAIFKAVSDEVVEECVGSGVVTDVQMVIKDNKLHVKLTKIPATHCTYCTYCDVVGHCTYCTYCTHCQ